MMKPQLKRYSRLELIKDQYPTSAVLCGDYRRLTMELLSLMAVMVGGTWLQLMCCAVRFA